MIYFYFNFSSLNKFLLHLLHQTILLFQDKAFSLIDHVFELFDEFVHIFYEHLQDSYRDPTEKQTTKFNY